MAENGNPLLKRPLYVYDLPPELLETLQVKLEDDAPFVDLTAENIQVPNSAPIRTPPDGNHNAASSKLIPCALCGLSFPHVQEQRLHIKSDLHGYNTKQRMRGAKAVSEQEFEKLVADLDESLSGSERSETESESNGESSSAPSKVEGAKLSILLKSQGDISAEDDEFGVLKRKRGSGKAPLVWFNTPMLPSSISLGVYRSLFTREEQDLKLIEGLRRKQLAPTPAPKRVDEEGGVPLPKIDVSPHMFLCMIGGGHFAAMVVSLTPKVGKKSGLEERQASVIAHKTFHRYTTRRKQGGAQSSNDMAKGNANSAGAGIRRYNEEALIKEIRDLLNEWKGLIATSELIFMRASGTNNRRTLFGPYDGQVLHQTDPRLRAIPFSSRRATQAELMRCFIELTRVKVLEVDEAAVAAAAAEAASEEAAKASAAAAKRQAASEKAAKPPRDEVAETATLHTTQLEALIRRSKAPALLSYITTNTLSPDFRLYPPDSPQHHHVPTPLHMASGSNSPALVDALLVRAGADPSIANLDGKTAFELAGDRATRDAFRLARAELGESKWDWAKTGIPDALSKTEVEERTKRERSEANAAEKARREADLEKLNEEEKRREVERDKSKDARREKKMGKGVMLGEKAKTPEERREEESRGMTDEMRRRVERERRARAAEERLKRLQPGTAR